MTVSILHHGDERLHYSDNSHRWIAPPDVEQSAWEAGLRAHLGLHRVTMGGPATVEETHEARPLSLPRQRTTTPRLPVPAPGKAGNRRLAPAPIQQLPRAG
jgi:hypothetical protein